MKSFAIYRLLGKSIHQSECVEGRKNVVYVPEVALELDQRRQECEDQAAKEEEEFLLREVGRVRKVLDDSYLPYGPTNGENEDGQITRLEPYLAYVQQKKGVAVVTETKERVIMPLETRYEDKGGYWRESQGEGQPAVESKTGRASSLEAVKEHGVSIAMPSPPISTPQPLLSINSIPLLTNSTTKSAQLSAQAKTVAEEASWVSDRDKTLPYWKRNKWESVATDAGIGTEEFSKRITAHAQPPREKFDYANETRHVLQPSSRATKELPHQRLSSPSLSQ